MKFSCVSLAIVLSMFRYAGAELEAFFVNEIVSGVRHSCALSTKGLVKCWGYNGDGHLGQGDRSTRGDGPNEMGNNLKPIDLGSGFVAAKVSSGGGFNCAISTEYQIKCWGWNSSGRLGLGDESSRGDDLDEMGNNLKTIDLGSDFVPVMISVGATHACSLSNKNQIKCWGLNASGQLGVGTTKDIGGKVGDMGNALKPVDLGSDFIPRVVYAMGSHTCAISRLNLVKCWGANKFGQLGLGDASNRGDSLNEMGDNLKVVDLGSDFSVSSLTGKNEHTCALSTKGLVKCWGRNSQGQLGQGDIHDRGDQADEMGDYLKPIELGEGFISKTISAYGNFSCALSTKGLVKCWGENSDGQLGQGDTNNRGDEPNEMGDHLKTTELLNSTPPTSLSTGYRHTCVLEANRTVTCWGANNEGQLGLGDTANRGDFPGEITDFTDL